MDRHIRFVLPLALALGFAGCISENAKLRQQGITQYNAGQYQQALDSFTKALEHDQFKAINHYYAGIACMKLAKLEQAVYHLKLAWQADPSVPEVKDALTECLLRQGHEDLALDFLERDAAITAKSKPATAGNAYLRRTQEQIYAGKGGDRLRVARSYERIEDLDNARLNYIKAVDTAPNDPQMHFALAEFYERIGKKPEAATEYTKVYQMSPDFPQIVAALGRVGLRPAN